MSAEFSHNDAYIAAPVVRQWLTFLTEMGLSRQTLLFVAGMTEEQLQGSTTLIAGPKLAAIMRHALHHGDDMQFGLKGSQKIDVATFGIAGFIALHCRTLREVTQRLPAFLPTVCSTGTLEMEPLPGALRLRWKSLTQDPELRQQDAEYCLGAILRMLRLITQQQLIPLRVSFEHAAPEQVRLLSSYQDIFSCPVDFGAHHASITLPAEWLDLALPQVNLELLTVLEQHGEEQLRRLGGPQGIATQVCSILHAKIGYSNASKESVAQQLGLTPRTLQRRLAENNLSYRELLARVRMDIAHRLLADPDKPLDQIARKTGFTEARAFSRFFQDQSGLTPQQHRARARRKVAEATPEA